MLRDPPVWSVRVTAPGGWGEEERAEAEREFLGLLGQAGPWYAVLHWSSAGRHLHVLSWARGRPAVGALWQKALGRVEVRGRASGRGERRGGPGVEVREEDDGDGDGDGVPEVGDTRATCYCRPVETPVGAARYALGLTRGGWARLPPESHWRRHIARCSRGFWARAGR